MGQNVMITGAGRSYALGYNLVLRYLEAGDTVVATVRKECAELTELKATYGDKLHIVIMDLGSTDSVRAAAEQVKTELGHLDLLINNAVTTCEDVEKDFMDVNLDLVTKTLDVVAVGTLRVIQAFYPILTADKKGTDKMGLIINISSEAGSISKCYRAYYVDYGMAKAAVNMGTMTFYNATKDDPNINIFCVHPGWIRTNGDENNPAPLSSYDAAEILRNLFIKRWNDKGSHRFITNENQDYPF